MGTGAAGCGVGAAIDVAQAVVVVVVVDDVADASSFVRSRRSRRLYRSAGKMSISI